MDNQTESEWESEGTAGENKKRKEVSPPEFARRSKKTNRTPVKSKNMAQEGSKKDMDEIKAMISQTNIAVNQIMQTNSDILNELREIKTEQIKHKKELENMKLEYKQLTERLDHIENIKIKEENQQVKQVVADLQRRFERIEKNEKKNNIIIKGQNFDGQDLKQEVEEFMAKKLEVKVSIKEARKVEIKKDDYITHHTIVKLHTWENKQNIMKNKNKLINSDIYVDNDLTKNEVEIQKTIRDIAKVEKEKGNQVKVSYQKMKINDRWMYWNADQRKLEEIDKRAKN